MYTKIKVLLTFGSLETVCVEMRSEKLLKIVTLPIHVEFRYVYTLSHM